ncbi:hypothetical protein H1C71_018856 [Ictidomys tridecemlineatus]|nr:hypothetical protein H1C71_018856 [Ictidomys tridecemlineatus]
MPGVQGHERQPPGGRKPGHSQGIGISSSFKHNSSTPRSQETSTCPHPVSIPAQSVGPGSLPRISGSRIGTATEKPFGLGVQVPQCHHRRQQVLGVRGTCLASQVNSPSAGTPCGRGEGGPQVHRSPATSRPAGGPGSALWDWRPLERMVPQVHQAGVLLACGRQLSDVASRSQGAPRCLPTGMRAERWPSIILGVGGGAGAASPSRKPGHPPTYAP